MPEVWESVGFGLYLHWPFCQAKCPYCDFNSHVAREIDEARWRRAYLAEIDRLARETPGRTVHSVFFGGGTPSLMSADLVGAILDRVRDSWTLASDVEITLEANPTSVEADRFRGYASAGVNRVSLGVQALNDEDLRRLGRLHSAVEALRAVELAQRHFERVSFDLIYARQHQGIAAWQEELGAALAMGPDHLSLYQLTIEDGTAFGDRAAAGKLAGLPDDVLGADLWTLTQEMTAAAGLPAYEISNHARPGQASRHNMIYWRSGDWGGIGPGAHGRLTLRGTRWATETHRGPLNWLSAVENGSGESVRDALSLQDMATEKVLMGLRLTEGIDLAEFVAMTDGLYDGNVKYLSNIGMLQSVDGRLRVSGQGRPVLNAVLGSLLDIQPPDRARRISSS